MSQTSKNNSALTRLASLFDDGEFAEIDAGGSGGARAGYGNVGGATVFAFSQDSAAASGGVDLAQLRKLSKVYELAGKTGSPVIAIYDSKGVALEDPLACLEASSGILRLSSRLSGVVPQIAVVVGPCAGFASIAASMADFTVMSAKGELFLTSAFTDKAAGGSAKQVGSLAYAERAGVVSVSAESETAAIVRASDILKLLPVNNLAPLPVSEDPAEPAFAADKCPVDAVCDEGSAIDLYSAVGSSRTALATLGGIPAGVIAIGGELCRGDTSKQARLIEVCDAFNIPVVVFLDSTGFKKSASDDEEGGIRNAARLTHVLAEATCPKITVVKGSAIGSAYSVFCGKNAGCDLSFAWPSAVIGPLSPEAAVALLWQDRIEKASDLVSLAAEYAASEASPRKAAAAGLIDAVIEPKDTRDRLISALGALSSKRVSRLPKKHGNLPI